MYRDTAGAGYTGWMKVGTEEIGVPLLAGSTFDRAPGIIAADDTVHGAAGDYSATTISYALGANAYNGRISTYFYNGLWASLWEDWVLTNRTLGKKLIYSPDGYATQSPVDTTIANVYKFNECYVQTLRIAADSGGAPPGSPVTFEAVLLGIGQSEKPTGAESYPPTYEYVSTIGGDANSGVNLSPVPYYRTRVTYPGFKNSKGETISCIMSWELSINNQTYPIYCANNSREPSYIKQGKMLVEGSCTLFHPDGILTPEDSYTTEGQQTFNPARVMKIEILDPDSAAIATFSFPVVVFTEYPHPIAAPNAPVVRTCRFRSFGTIVHPAIVLGEISS